MANDKNKKGLFSKQKESYDDFEFDLGEGTETGVEEEVSIMKGQRHFKDLFAPSMVCVPDKDHILIGNKCVRSYYMQGYPNRAYVGWLDDLYNYHGNMDTHVIIKPADNRKALDELTKNITKYQAQLQIEQERGNIKHITELQNKVQMLFAEREQLELNETNLYHGEIVSNLICNDLEELNKEAQMLESTLRGKNMSYMPAYLRMEDGFKTAMPLCKNFLSDKARNLNTGAVAAMFPFYNSEISHPNGVFIGPNGSTGTPMYLDFYDKTKVNNTNISVFGKAGSGKSFFVSLLMMRSILKGIRHAVVDPEGEYIKLTEAMGGVVIRLSPTSDMCMNVFEIEEEAEVDDDGNPTGTTIVDVKEKVSDLLNLISVMVGDVDAQERSIISDVLLDLYAKFGINTNPESLYYRNNEYDEAGGQFFVSGKKKVMPTFSDFHDLLEKRSQRPDGAFLHRIVNSLRMFKKDGVYGMFDCQSSFDLNKFSSAPIITFDVHQLEEGILRPIGMYIALSWIWEKFCKKQQFVKKRVVCDEAWMLVSKSMKGYEYTSKFLETSARRIRKRRGGLLVASQNFREFTLSEEGLAVLSNTGTRFFLQQSETDIDALQEKFKLSDGEKNFLKTAKTGQMLIKTNTGENAIAYALAFPFEADLIVKKKKETKEGK